MCQGHKLEETASLFVSCYISNLYPSVYYSTVYHSINIRGGVEGGVGVVENTTEQQLRGHGI